MALSRKGDCKMKKFIALTCMIACIFGMTACASNDETTQYEQYKLDRAIYKAEQQYIPAIESMLGMNGVDGLDDYTAEEVEYLIGQMYNIEVDGNAFVSAMSSFHSAYEEIGVIEEITDATSVIDDKQIIVNLSIKGSEQDAQAEIVVSNDMFFKLESASLNKVSTMGDSMTKAAMNTLLGMGSVFVVLILISLIISCFAIIPKLQGAFARRKEAKEAKATAGIDNAVAQISEQEEINAADDLELVAVIAAAIAASEGAASTDGFVVRSIKRRRAY